MHYIDYDPNKDLHAMKIASTALPTFGDDDVLIKVSAFGLNRADTLQRQGKYPPPPGESDILGLEVAGTVAAIGKNVTDLNLGDRVFGLVAGGGYAQYARIKSAHIMLTPASLSDEQAAGIAEVFLTAYQSLFALASLKKGQNVLVHAGASGVGLAAIQLAVSVGSSVAVTSSSDVKLARCQQMGATHLINYHDHCFAEYLRDQHFNADVIIDFVGGDYVNKNLKVLRQDGIIVQLAMLAGRYVEQLDMALMLMKRARLQGSTLRSRSDDYKTQLIAGFRQHFFDKFTQAKLIANIDTVYAAKDVAKAHQRLEQNETMGKLIGRWQ
ncbi:NAD(P)H-quinone oxidoreductase [Aliiglaciecola litoralis]